MSIDVENEKIESVRFAIAIVRYGKFFGIVDDLKMVDEYPFHVNYFDVEFSYEVLKIQLHLTLVGVGQDAELGVGCGFIDAEEGTD